MGRAEDIKKGCRKVNIMYTCMLMEKWNYFRNVEKMNKGEWWKEGISTMIYCKNLCKCHNVPPVQQYKREINLQTKDLPFCLYLHCLLEHKFSNNSIMIIGIPVVFVVMYPFSYLILLIWVLYLLYLVMLAKGLSS
jgi:hypothetical protein